MNMEMILDVIVISFIAFVFAVKVFRFTKYGLAVVMLVISILYLMLILVIGLLGYTNIIMPITNMASPVIFVVIALNYLRKGKAK